MISKRTRDGLREELQANPIAILGVVLVLGMLFVAVFAPLIAPHDPTAQNNANTHQPPIGFGGDADESVQMVDGEMVTVTDDRQGTIAHPLGTDANGRDLLSRAIYGARTTILVAVTAMIISAVVGTATGLAAGYYGGNVDSGIMRFVDVVLAFPSLLVALTLFPVLGPLTVSIPDPVILSGLVENRPETLTFPATITIAISAVIWVWIARVARSEAIAVKNEEYVLAAKTMGMTDASIIRKHVLPNCLTPILVLATIQVASIIITESSLSFLGFSGTTLSWGYDIAQGRDYLGTSWWIATIPGVFIMSTVIGINLVGDWIRDALDPNIQGEGR